MTENLLVSLNDIEEKEASWLVPQRMPKGQIIILAGDGGSGKTSCWCSLAAAIMEMWKACEEDEIADAKEKYTSKALPEQLEKIKSVYEKRYKKVRQIALEQVESETKSIKQRNQGKFKPDFVDLELLKELNAISAAGIPMTESEVEAYCKRAIASRSSFCVRAVQNIAKKSEIRLTVPTEDAAIRVIDEANNRLKEIVHIYDGKFLFGDRNKNQSLIMDAHGYEDSGFLGRLEKEYQAATLEDIKISRMSRKEFDTKNAVTRVDEMKKPVELVEVRKNMQEPRKALKKPCRNTRMNL